MAIYRHIHTLTHTVSPGPIPDVSRRARLHGRGFYEEIGPARSHRMSIASHTCGSRHGEQSRAAAPGHGHDGDWEKEKGSELEDSAAAGGRRGRDRGLFR